MEKKKPEQQTEDFPTSSENKLLVEKMDIPEDSFLKQRTTQLLVSKV